ncbi:hypothetical protein KCG43_21330, partial [Photobacterium sp. WH24]|uniref:hypothetical protein n=1 Tax=Photobacterium sp. WH24 TaxID=2827237 RepID=UPI001C446026
KNLTKRQLIPKICQHQESQKYELRTLIQSILISVDITYRVDLNDYAVFLVGFLHLAFVYGALKSPV